jgi:hypothetical protein
MEFTNEHLNQLIDGELDSAIEDELRQALQRDPKLASQYAELALANARFQDSVSVIDDVPVKESILNLLAEESAWQQSSADRTSNAGSGGILPRLMGTTNIRLTLSRPGMVTAYAFILLGVFSVLFLQYAAQEEFNASQDVMRGFEYGLLDEHNPVADMLTNAPSGLPRKIAGSESLTVIPVLSFAGVTGDYCREYTLTDNSSSHRAVACFQGDSWRVVLSARTDDVSRDQYQSASVITPGSFEHKINQIIAGEPLSYEQELILIQRGWRANN